MTCDTVREALSARLDGEPTGWPDGSLDAHLTGCAGCQAWLAGAERLNRAVRVQPVEVPDLTARVLAQIAQAPLASTATSRASRHEPPPHRQILRVAVAVAAVAQLAVAVPVLLGGLGVVDDPHASRELASFDVALAVGFALAAYRPDRARAYVPIAFVLAACLAVTSAVDIANASTAFVHEVGHLAAVVQAALLWALGRASRADAVGGGPVAPRAATVAR